MSWRRVLVRVAVGAGLTVVVLVLGCLWGLGSFRLALVDHPSGFSVAWPVTWMWALLSLIGFLLATGGIAVLIAYGIDRGRPGIWLSLAAAAVLIGLITWGYVAVTGAAMAPYDNIAPPAVPQPTR